MSKNDIYHGNRHLKKSDVQIEYTHTELMEYAKCVRDPEYFIRTYVKIINVDDGLVNFIPYDYQSDIIKTSVENRFVICKLPRQAGKTTAIVGLMLHYLLFQENYAIAILAHKLQQAQEILSRIQLAYENLPKWLQQGIIEWNKRNITLENGCSIIASSTTSSAIRGGSFNCVSGDSVVTLKIANKLYNVTLNTVFQCFQNANSSKYIKEPEKGRTYVFRKQIQEILQSTYTQTKTNWANKRSSIYRKAPYITKMYGWERRQRKFGNVDSSRAFDCSSIVGEMYNRQLSQINVFCFEQDAFWTAGSNNQNVPTSSVVIYEDVVRSTEKKSFGKKTFRGYQKQNIFSQQGEKEKLVSRSATKKCSESIKKICWGWFERITSAKDIFVSNWKKENSRTCEQNKLQPYKDSQNSSKTSRYETFARSAVENEFSSAWQSALEQRQEISVFTSRGFKNFLGIKKTEQQQTISICVDGKNIKCTPNHLINIKGKWVPAKTISTDPHNGCIEDVYDLVGVEDTHSFICNGINVHNCVYLDEFAFIPNNMQEKFFSSTYPTISSGKTTKVLITSTPNGLNLFYKMWRDSELGRNSYKRISVHWSDVPGRDEAWKDETIRNTSKEQFRVEFECEFVGSSNTLIHPDILRNLVWEEPIVMHGETKIYREPEKGKSYVITVDTARGQGNDYSAFVVFDISEMPYKVCAIYRCNTIDPLLYPNIILSAADKYNKAYIMVETNDIGQQVCDIIHHDLEYDNVLTTSRDDRSGIQVLSGGFGGQSHMGLRTTSQTKRFGCSLLKSLVENHKLLLNCDDIIYELMRFVADNKNSYSAEDGNDDAVMCCVIFAWMTNQQFFKELTNIDIRASLQQQKQKELDEDVIPFFISSNEDADSSDVILSVGNDKWLAFS